MNEFSNESEQKREEYMFNSSIRSFMELIHVLLFVAVAVAAAVSILFFFDFKTKNSNRASSSSSFCLERVCMIRLKFENKKSI